MVRKASLVLFLTLWVGSPVAGQQWAQKMFATTAHDFGSVARRAKAEYHFVLTNLYEEDVHVASARASCGCTNVRILDPWLKTFQRGAVVASLNTRAYRGSRGATITVVIDKPFLATVQLHVKGYVRDDVELEPGAVELGDVDHGTAAERTISVRRRGHFGWRILEVASANPHLSGEVVGSSWNGHQVVCQLRVRLDEEAPVGYVRDHLVLTTNDRWATELAVPVEGRVLPPIVVSPNSLFLGALHPGEKVTKQVVVHGKQPFRVISVTGAGEDFEAKIAADEAPKPVHVIPLTFTASDQPGKVVQTVRFETDLADAAPELSAVTYVQP